MSKSVSGELFPAVYAMNSGVFVKALNSCTACMYSFLAMLNWKAVLLAYIEICIKNVNSMNADDGFI